jgi:mono/diheme cytochrome c family protein
MKSRLSFTIWFYALLLVLFGGIVTIAGCDYSLKEQQPVSPVTGGAIKVAVSPILDTLQMGTTMKLSARVTGSSDSLVLWSVASGPGSIDANGLYTAPATIDTAPLPVTIRVRAHADTTVSATARIILVKEPVVHHTLVVVVVQPESENLYTTETKQFTASVLNSDDMAVTWSIVSGPGTISSTGLYTAPATLYSSPTTVLIRAVAHADSAASDTARVTVTQYVAIPYSGVCFQRDVLPIFNSLCANSGCHDIDTRKERYILSRYTDTTIGGRTYHGIHFIGSSAFENMISGGDDRMPPYGSPQLTQAQIDTIRKWYMEGARNNNCSDPEPGTCDTSNVTYKGTIRTLLQNNCVGCHTGATTTNNQVDLSTYVGVQTVAINGRMIGSIEHAPALVAMPYHIDKLFECQIRQIKAWVNGGALNN